MSAECRNIVLHRSVRTREITRCFQGVTTFNFSGEQTVLCVFKFNVVDLGSSSFVQERMCVDEINSTATTDPLSDCLTLIFLEQSHRIYALYVLFQWYFHG